MSIDGFGDRLKSARRRSEIRTQQKLADELEVSKAVVSHWEKGKNYPEFATFAKIVAILGADAHELLTGEVRGPMLDTEARDLVERIMYVKSRWPGRFDAIRALVQAPVDNEKIPAEFRNPGSGRGPKN